MNFDCFMVWMICWTTALLKENRCAKFCRRSKCESSKRAPLHARGAFFDSLGQWAAEYNLSAARLEQSVREWENEFALSAGQVLGSYQGQPTMAAKKYSDSVLAESGSALLAAGVMPSSGQLAAMGLTRQQALLLLGR